MGGLVQNHFVGRGTNAQATASILIVACLPGSSCDFAVKRIRDTWHFVVHSFHNVTLDVGKFIVEGPITNQLRDYVPKLEK